MTPLVDDDICLQKHNQHDCLAEKQGESGCNTVDARERSGDERTPLISPCGISRLCRYSSPFATPNNYPLDAKGVKSGLSR